MFPRRKHNDQLVLQISSNILNFRSFQSYANSSREYKNRTTSIYETSKLTSKLGKYSMRKSQLQVSMSTSQLKY